MKKMKFSLLLASTALTIAAIPGVAQQQVYTYECDAGQSFSAQYGSNAATVWVDNQTLKLPALAASPGQARYSDGRYLLFTTANNTEAFVEVDGDRTHEGCIARPTAQHSAPTASPTPSPSPVRARW
jgi:membrane-bound inhibitor of C-type lysozyme